MSAARDYSALVGHAVIVYVGNTSYGPVRLVAIEDGYFVLAHWTARDRFTIRRRGTVLRRYA